MNHYWRFGFDLNFYPFFGGCQPTHGCQGSKGQMRLSGQVIDRLLPAAAAAGHKFTKQKAMENPEIHWEIMTMVI